MTAEMNAIQKKIAKDDRLVGVISQADIALQGKDKDTGQVVEDISRQPDGPRTC